MIKAINNSPLNSTNELFAKCKYCGFEITIKHEGQPFNTDNNGNILPDQDTEFECDNCGKSLTD